MNDKITFKKDDNIEAIDIYGEPIKGTIDGFIGSINYAIVKIEGLCCGTTVDLTNNSVRKITE
ncbi:hypothetical protein [Clostridium beijerinckii]|uniref:hypothetical protein n=1 Tax=Clostridium beijerinckii TaxID=1520 RepID=UPI00156F4C1C|nr:hypothetical protein [Clostridium beijerinckii]NRU52439.1 hypothetical protein [Clostridium beijerinckii]NYC69116.1 hypothetical protein [Clostridium beijerinckii]NYC91923.1 hypothetical protein [Clostridium beijerinckii]